MRTPEKDAIMNSRLVTLTIVVLGWWVPLRVSAQLTPAEQALLNRLDVARTVAVTRRFSEEIVDNRSGVGAGSVVAGSADEKLVANVIEQEFRNMGITSVRQEPFPVRHYEYGEVVLTADGEPIEAVSLHAAGGTWGTRDGVPYARGNDGDGRRVRAELVDAGDGYLADYVEAGDVRGKVVLVRRGNGWPTYQILEAAHRGALALILYDYVSSLEEALKQDSMWYHEQLATVSIRKRDASRLLDELKAGPVEIVLENRIDVADGTSQNVVATILGTELPDEWIVVSAHYDRWFQAAADNSVGVAVMLELARAFSSDYTPRRSLMFVGAGAEEAGVEATESDWLAGSLAFVRAHPEVTRSMAFAFNVDLAGWTADTGAVNGTHDALPFLRQVVADLGLADRLTVRGGMSSNVDAWNLGSVGGGAVGYLHWGNPFGGSSYTKYYHTQLDLYRPEDFQNLPHDLRIGALSVNRIDQAAILPIQFTGIAEWVERGLAADLEKVPGASGEEALRAARGLMAKAEQLETARQGLTERASIDALNRLLMSVRKDLVPWLVSRGGSALRTGAHATALSRLTEARTAAEQGDATATIAALEELQVVRAAARVSPEVYAAERLYWYTGDDWSVAFDQKPRPVSVDVTEIHRRLKAGGPVAAEAPRLRQLEAESRGRLGEALFIITGKLDAATQSLDQALAAATR